MEADRPRKRMKSDPDLKIILDDGEVMVHSVILMLASPVFDRMLNSSMVEGQGAEATLPGKTESEFSAFYKSLQLKTMEPLTVESATVLCRWADEYQIDELKAKCEKHLIQFAPVDGESLKYAATYKLQERTAQCIDAMKTDVEKYLDVLRSLAEDGMEEHLKSLWPTLCQKAGAPCEEMPSAPVLQVMWPFLAAAVRGKTKGQVLLSLRADSRSWDREMMDLRLPGAAGGRAIQLARQWQARVMKDLIAVQLS